MGEREEETWEKDRSKIHINFAIFGYYEPQPPVIMNYSIANNIHQQFHVIFIYRQRYQNLTINVTYIHMF